MLEESFDKQVRGRCAEIIALRAKHGMRCVLDGAEELLASAVEGELGELFVAPDRLKEAVLFPDASKCRPSALGVDDVAGTRGVVSVGPGLLADLAAWMGDWQRGSAPPRDGAACGLYKALEGLGAFEVPRCLNRSSVGLLFAGHACVRVGFAGNAALFDPFLLPTSNVYPGSYQPLTARELEPDAIFITHSHPDHFCPGTLMRFGADIPIYVPYVGRESVLAVDMAARLREIGFRSVAVLDWHAEARVGSTRVVAMPFYGEQPTCAAQLHGNVRNAGNGYFVQSEEQSVVLTADGGRDGRGSTVSVAEAGRRRLGRADVLFGGHRGWSLYPISYLFTSVARYLVFVPRELWGARQRIMDDADDLLDAAERWGARLVLPYAGGGAPWYWNIGLGPRADAESDAPGALFFDPLPERVVAAARARSAAGESFVASPVRVVIARPGDALELRPKGIRITREEPHAWPYEDAS
jgi:L-ascorbate metabolism protein UlaG (beta-lactamase superfamily)